MENAKKITQNENDTKRLENLTMALQNQLSSFEYAKLNGNYLQMSECASNIQKLSYTIYYLQNN